MRKHFRIRTIQLNDEEELAGLHAAVSDDAYLAITDLVGGVEATTTTPDITVSLNAAQVRGLFARAGDITGLDPRHEITSEIYDALSVVIYGLLDGE